MVLRLHKEEAVTKLIDSPAMKQQVAVHEVEVGDQLDDHLKQSEAKLEAIRSNQKRSAG